MVLFSSAFFSWRKRAREGGTLAFNFQCDFFFFKRLLLRIRVIGIVFNIRRREKRERENKRSEVRKFVAISIKQCSCGETKRTKYLLHILSHQVNGYMKLWNFASLVACVSSAYPVYLNSNAHQCYTLFHKIIMEYHWMHWICGFAAIFSRQRKTTNTHTRKTIREKNKSKCWSHNNRV